MPYNVKVKETRKKLGMSQIELCRKSGVSRPTLSNIERGKINNITIKTLRKIAKALSCRVSDIFTCDV